MFNPNTAAIEFVELRRKDIRLFVDIEDALVFDNPHWNGNICYHPADEGKFEIYLMDNGFTERFDTLREAVLAMDLITRFRSYDQG